MSEDTAPASPKRSELMALSDEVEKSEGLVRIIPGGTCVQLGIKKTAQIIAALRASAQRCEDGEAPKGWDYFIAEAIAEIAGERSARPPVAAGREEIAKIIAPALFAGDALVDEMCEELRERALVKADTILSLTPDASRIRELEGARRSALEECAKIARQTAKRCVREGTPGDAAAEFIERAIAALTDATKASEPE